MAAPKKATVTWNIPEVKPIKSHKSPRIIQSPNETLTDKYSSHSYTDTFEESSFHSESQVYSDTFVNDTVTYSDTFVQDSTSSKKRGGTILSEVTEQIVTATSATEAQDTTIKTALDTEALETIAESVYDLTDTQPSDSNVYSDTFESSGRTKAESDFEETVVTFSTQSSFTDTKSLQTPSPRELSTHGPESLDLSHVAPGYDGQSYMLTADDNTDNDVDDRTITEDYSYTFEPTEVSSHVYLVDPEEVQKESLLTQVSERAQAQFVQSMLAKLQHKKHPSLQATIKETGVEEIDCRPFCKKKIKMLKKRKIPSTPEEPEPSNKPHPLAKVPPTSLCDYGVPDIMLERAKLVNIMSAMKKASSHRVHDPRKCEECKEKKLYLDTEEAQRAFVLSRSKSLQNRIIDEQVEQHMLRMNSISLIGEIARGLPRPTEQREKILDQLLEPILGRNMMR